MSNADCDGTFVPKAGAPPSWIVKTTDLYSGRNIDVFAGVYRAAEFRSNTGGTQSPEQLAARLADWRKALQDEADKAADASAIVDLGLTADLCSKGRPPDPNFPNLTPEALGNGSVGNAVLELVKQQYFDQYCRCMPRDYARETCPCVRYEVNAIVRRGGSSPVPEFPQKIFVDGRVGGLERQSVTNGNSTTVRIGPREGVGCPQIENGAGRVAAIIEPSASEANDWSVRIVSIKKVDPNTPDVCQVEPPPEPPPPYEPGIPGIIGLPLPPPVVPNPDGSLPPVRIPFPFTLPIGTPSNCPPCEECEEPDMYYWKLEKVLPGVLLFAGSVGLSGRRINVPSNAGKLDIRYEVSGALENSSLRNYRRAGSSQGNDDVFLRAAQLFLRGPNDAVVQQKDAVMPLTQFTIPWEDNDSAKSLIILPLGADIQFQVLDSGYRWVQKKFEKID